MSNAAQIVAVITLMASLYLVIRNYRSHSVAPQSMVRMALAWAVIIAVAVAIIRSLAG